MVQALARERACLAAGICAILMAHYAFFFTNEYWAHRWLDVPMHFAGGAWFAAFAAHYLFSRRALSAVSGWYEALVLVSFAVFAGVVWEFHEFIGDLYIRSSVLIMQTSVADNMKDLFFDMLGAVCFVGVRAFHTRKKMV